MTDGTGLKYLTNNKIGQCDIEAILILVYEEDLEFNNVPPTGVSDK